MKWSVFRDFETARMYSVVQEPVFPFIKKLGDAIFKLPTPLMLSRVVDGI